ncbi:MAG: YdcF family protein [Granulosicoccus sp.]
MVDGFLLKKLVSLLVQLIPGALLLLLALLIASRWWPVLCRVMATGLCTLLLCSSIPPFSNFFVSRLENGFPVLQAAPEDTAMILVLGSGHRFVADRPPNSVLSATALSRLAEGVRLWKTRQESYLALSGAASHGVVSHARAMQMMAVQSGVPAERIVLFEQTRDTREEIVAAVRHLRASLVSGVIDSATSATGPRLVVTSSATHLPRVALMLSDQEMNYSLAPTDYLVSDAPWYRPGAFFVLNADRALHEWVGMLWYRLRVLLKG